MGKPYYAVSPTANSEAAVTVPASTDICLEIEHVGFSYDSTPTGGVITIESPSGTVLQKYYVTTSGPGPVPMSGSCLKGAAGSEIVVRLTAGGSGVNGSVNCIVRQ
jgi:hypothetical protein